MRDPLHVVFHRCELEEPIFAAYEFRLRPLDEFDQLMELGMLADAPPTNYLPCEACGCEHEEEVLRLSYPGSDRVSLYLRCPEYGPERIEPERLLQWRVDIPGLLRAVLGGAAAELDPAPILGDRLWRVGKLRTPLGPRQAFFGRRLVRSDAWEVLRAGRIPPRSIVLTSVDLPQEAPGGGPRPLILPLARLARWREGRIEFDGDDFQSEAAAHWSAAAPRPERRKRGDRTADIEALTVELRQHVRAARQHALDTRQRTGEAKLLPRPTQKQLARLTGRSPTAVNRCLKDESATELRILWELALDLEAIVRGGRAKNCTYSDFV